MDKINESRTNEIIFFLGENIFPLSNKLVFDKYGEDILSLVADGYISTSRSKIGIHPTMMSKIKGYLELTNKGWDYYESLKTQNEKVK